MFTLSAFCSLFDASKEPKMVTELKKLLKNSKKECQDLQLADEESLLNDNFVLSRYKKSENEMDTEKLFNAANSVFDL
jgi:HEPN domain-containing protein